jgi:hypothetical protein
MKNIITILFALFSLHVFAQVQIVSGEYFIDSDPGFGSAQTFDITGTNNVSTNFQVPISDLSLGIHVLHTRVKSNNGIWSLYARKPFYVFQLPNTNREIIAAEYFLDSDPGLGNATPLNVIPSYEFAASYAINIGNLDKGLHTLHIRVMNNLQKWSLLAVKNIFVIPEIVNYNIVEMEYFIDEDPGIGNGIQITSFTEANVISELFDIVLSDTLSLGEHLLHVRVKNEVGNWSIPISEPFVIDETVGIRPLPLHINVFPNPTNSVIHLNGELSADASYKLFDLKGKCLLYHKGSVNSIDMSEFQQGNYLLQITDEGKTISKMIAKY